MTDQLKSVNLVNTYDSKQTKYRYNVPVISLHIPLLHFITQIHITIKQSNKCTSTQQNNADKLT